MLRYLLAGLLLLHGLIHWMGFAKAFGLAEIKNIAGPISKPLGWLWLLSALCFIAVAVMLVLQKSNWWMAALPALLCSQIVIMQSWQDAKYGTIANIIILLCVVLAWGNHRFEGVFHKDVQREIQKQSNSAAALITEKDLARLPAPVHEYLRYSGAVGKPRPQNMRVVFEGEMREKGKNYFPFRSVQYNFFQEPARLFFMKGRMKGLTVPGYHHYQEAKAVMDIRLFGLFPVANASGPVMDTTETVTLFNDMCLLAPASLTDPRIQWENRDRHSAVARFTNGGITISAMLFFNEKGQLVDFISEDRTAIQQQMKLKFSTPVHAYQEIQGRQILKEGDAVWHYPDGAFVYGRFRLIEIDYNVTAF